MSLDARAFDIRAMAAQNTQAQQAQEKQMQVQMTFANLQIAQNLVMSQYLYEEEKQGDPTAKEIRAKAKQIVLKYLNGLEASE